MKDLNDLQRSWVLYDWANSAYSIIITTAILPVFFKLSASAGGLSEGTSTAYWGYVNSAGTFAVALLAPFLGRIADSQGRKRQFFITFLILGLVSTLLLSGSPAGSWKYIMTFYLLTLVGFSGANIFSDSFLTDISVSSQMDRISSLGYAWGYIGSVIPYMISVGILILLKGSGTAFKASFIITALWWGFFSLPFIRRSKKVPVTKRSEEGSILDTLKEIVGNKSLLLFLMAYFFYIDGVGTIIKMASIYASSMGIGSVGLLTVLLVSQLVAFPSALIFGRLSKKYSNTTLIKGAILIYIFSCIYAYQLDSIAEFWVLGILVALAQGGIQALSRSYFGRIIPKEKSNEYFGFYNIFGKFAAVMGPFLVGVTIQFSGKTNVGILAILPLFFLGFILLTMADRRKGSPSGLSSEFQ